MGGKKIQSMWGSATNFALAGTLFGASISLLSLFCYCCRRTQRESLNSCRALFGGSIVLLFLFCYCCQRSKTKKPPAPTPTPRTISNLSEMTASTTNQQLTDISVIEAIDEWQQNQHHQHHHHHHHQHIPRAITPPPPYEQVAYKKTIRTTDSPPSYDSAMAAMQSYGYV